MSTSATATVPSSSLMSSATATTSKRITAIDALRGFDMFWILGADDLVYALKALGSGAFITGLAAQLNHKDWTGFAFYDLIFPLFVFIVGVSLVFSLTGSLQQEGVARTHWKIVRRFIILFFLGLLFYGGFFYLWVGGASV